MSSYQALKQQQQNEVNAFPMKFAFSKEQFEKAMHELGLQPTDTDKIYKFGDTGGFYRKTDSPALEEMLNRHEKEFNDAIASDTTGDGFIYEMFNYELSNHEYCITHDLTDTLYALQITPEEIEKNNRLLHGLRKAIKAQKQYQ